MLDAGTLDATVLDAAAASPPPPAPMDPSVEVWYGTLCFFAVLNSYLLVATVLRHPTSSAYQRWMRWLAVPMVLECAWRGVFPSLYLQRYTFWDTPLNSVIVDRTLACVGELAWTGQLALALAHVDGELRQGGSRWVRCCCVLSLVIMVVAEGASYYNTATTNELWAAIEVALDALSWVVLLPGAVMLSCELHARGGRSTARSFCLVFAIAAVIYPCYNAVVDCPMYLARYKADQAAGKHYFPFWAGLGDAATRRVPVRTLAAWEQDMFWMVAYFGPAAWSSIWLVRSPSVGAASAPSATRVKPTAAVSLLAP